MTSEVPRISCSYCGGHDEADEMVWYHDLPFHPGDCLELAKEEDEANIVAEFADRILFGESRD